MKRIQNLKIGVKIICGFLLVAVIAGAVGAIGILSLNGVGDSYAVAYADSVLALESMERVSASFQKMRTDLFQMTLAETRADKESSMGDLDRHRAEIDAAFIGYKAILEKYKAEEVEQELKLIGAVESAVDAFAVEQKSFVGGVALDPARRAEAYRLLVDGGKIHTLAQTTENAIFDLIKYNEDYAAQQIEANASMAKGAVTFMAIIILIGVLFSVFVGMLIARGIAKPINTLMDAAAKMAQGDLDVQFEIHSKDETGVLAETFRHMAKTWTAIIGDISYGLEGMSNGDFTVSSKVQELYVGGYVPMMEAMYKMITKISATIRQIDTAAEQVAAGSDQVSSGAQALASGSAEQAASIEELSASVEKIAEQSEETSETVAAAARSVRQAGVGVSDGNEHMEQLTKAMADIGSASGQIASITKVIEDIAFQTNILALNAAIEAARAGNAGKGFAVVADEVRSLAAKSAEAARQTGELIEASVTAVERGANITAQTAQILKDVGASASEVTESFGKIERSIAEQTGAIEQITQGLSQISAVVQTNAATAEENSATSEEMSAQAAALRDEVGRFKLAGEEKGPDRRDPEGMRALRPKSGGLALNAPADSGECPADAKAALPGGKGFGKY